MKKLLAVSISATLILIDAASAACWKRAHGRGAGHVLNSCPGGTEQDGALCYPHCRHGYNGVGPVCWQNCPGGFRDDGAFCGKPSSYGRGAGYVIWDKKKCERKHS